eukprot:1136386-Pelagomonas_calceolata.AAC.3
MPRRGDAGCHGAFSGGISSGQNVVTPNGLCLASEHATPDGAGSLWSLLLLRNCWERMAPACREYHAHVCMLSEITSVAGRSVPWVAARNLACNEYHELAVGHPPIATTVVTFESGASPHCNHRCNL